MLEEISAAMEANEDQYVEIEEGNINNQSKQSPSKPNEQNKTVDNTKVAALQKTNSSFLYSMGHATSKDGSNDPQSRLKFTKEVATENVKDEGPTMAPT